MKPIKKNALGSGLDNKTSGVVVDSIYAVHTQLGPGLLESAYEACLTHELVTRGVKVERQVEVPVTYKDVKLDVGFRIDLLVEKSVVVELKTVEDIKPVHEAQLLTYLKLTGHRIGLLVNFNVKSMKYGIKRLVV